jgi:hypothetical protein
MKATTPKRKCKAHKTNGDPCPNYAMHGQLICAVHGGRARQNKAKAAERIVAEQARTVLARLDVEPVADPLTALGLLAGQVLAFKDALAEQVNRLEAIRYEDAKGAEQLRSEVAVFERALGECRQVLGLMARLDIDARLAAIEETKAQAVVAAIDAGLAAAGVTGVAATEARQVVARHLRSVA